MSFDQNFMRIIIGLLLILPILGYSQTWKDWNHQGLELYNSGNYEASLEKYTLALREAEKEYGKHSDEYLTSASNIAYSYRAIGDFNNAGQHFQQVIQGVFEKKGPAHLDYAEAQENLAKLYLSAGDLDRAEQYLNSAMQSLVDIFNSNKTHYEDNIYRFSNLFITISNSRASLFNSKGQIMAAIAEMEELVQWIKGAFPDDYPQEGYYRNAIGNLSEYYLQSGKADSARPLILERLELEKALDPKSLDYLYSLQSLGSLYRIEENYDSALMVWDDLLSTIEAGSFSGTDLHLANLINKSEMAIQYQDYESAISCLGKALEIQENRIGINPKFYHPTLSNLAGAYWFAGNLAQADSIYSRLMERVIDGVVRNFTFLSDNEKRSFYADQRFYIDDYLGFALTVSDLVPLQEGPEKYINKDVSQALYDLQIMTKAIILNPSDKMGNRILNSGDESLINALNQWKALKERLAMLYGSPEANAEEIRNIEFEGEEYEKWLIRNSRNFREGFTVTRKSWRDIQKTLKPGEVAVEMVRFVDGLLYGALILTDKTIERPAMALMSSTQSRHLEREYYSFYSNAIGFKIQDTLSYEVYWKPVMEVIKDNLTKGQRLEKIYFSPEGIYNQINLNTLFIPEKGHYLIDEVEINLVSNSRDILMEHEGENRDPVNAAAIFGNPAFTLDGKKSVFPYFDDLPGTRLEILAIDNKLTGAGWNTSVFEAGSASKESLKSIENPRILHIATHGFFKDQENLGAASIINVLLNSGIALAGANNQNLMGAQDGILTAFEAINLTLDHTDLVVLSACETGLGTTHPGEGVYGLQRALRAAGARQILISLWKVDDRATQDLMSTFYDQWIKTGDTISSFREAQTMLRIKYPDPYFWGAFIVSGL